MIAYIYDNNGYYLQQHDCQPNPLKAGQFLYPSNCTTIPAPSCNATEQAKFNGTGWVKETIEIVEDHTGETAYLKIDRQTVIIDYVGPLHDEHTLLVPSSKFDEWDGSQWVKNLVLEAKAFRDTKIRISRNRLNHGLNTIAYLGAINAAKGSLTEAEVEELTTTYAPIASLLSTGSLETARTKINELTLGTIVTDADRTELVDYLDEKILESNAEIAALQG